MSPFALVALLALGTPELSPGTVYDPPLPTIKKVLGYEPGEESLGASVHERGVARARPLKDVIVRHRPPTSTATPPLAIQRRRGRASGERAFQAGNQRGTCRPSGWSAASA